jgi:hypothetical protein
MIVPQKDMTLYHALEDSRGAAFVAHNRNDSVKRWDRDMAI